MRPSLFLICGLILLISAEVCHQIEVFNWQPLWLFTFGIFAFCVPVDADAKAGLFEATLILLALFVTGLMALTLIAFLSPAILVYFLGKEVFNG